MLPTISIGISAYNEEANIISLITSLLSQSGKFTLTELIIVSDGSTDRTVLSVQMFKDPRIRLFIHETRYGKIQGVNEIVEQAQGDILILLDADVLPTNTNFISYIIDPFIKNNKIGLVGADVIPMHSEAFLEKVFSYSHIYKQSIYKKLNNGNNIYLCHGRAHAFSKSFYSRSKWINDLPEDAQSYLFCIQEKYEFSFASRAKVLFRSPKTLTDHAKQHYRFRAGKKQLQMYFSPFFLDKQYYISRKLQLEFLMKFFSKNPLSMISYIGVTCLLYINPFQQLVYKSLWPIAQTTKGSFQ